LAHSFAALRPIIQLDAPRRWTCGADDWKSFVDGSIMTYLRLPLVLGLALLTLMMFGCAGRTEILPNSEPALRRKPPEFAADAARRFPYKANAPRGGEAVGRAQVGYTLNKLEIENLSDVDWDNVEVWVNQQYVVWLPKLKARPDRVTSIPFQAIYNDSGHSFPTDNSKVLINKVEVYHDGKMYDVRTQLAD
jgi:hypothetical protein